MCFVWRDADGSPQVQVSASKHDGKQVQQVYLKHTSQSGTWGLDAPDDADIAWLLSVCWLASGPWLGAIGVRAVVLKWGGMQQQQRLEIDMF